LITTVLLSSLRPAPGMDPVAPQWSLSGCGRMFTGTHRTAWRWQTSPSRARVSTPWPALEF